MAMKVTEHKPTKVLFASKQKMSLNLVELRIDNHLNRIMKNHRLINFCNAIKNLPVQSRVCEKLIEVMNSCEGLIERRIALIKEAKDVLMELRQIHRQLNILDDFQCKDTMMEIFDRIKQVSATTEQIVWALNSNKEHLRYIARVSVIPEIYYRGINSGGTGGGHHGHYNQNDGDHDESILMRLQLVTVIEHCERVIEICKLLRVAIASLMKDIYAEVNF